MNEIKVSISIITYKHAKYIRKCLDSILAQKVNFKYQIVVGEDCSNDGTREILLEYKEKYPDIFVLLLNEQNMGASKNSYNVKLYCTGEYILGCEGDDFWVDEYRLQKQADFLDANPEYVAVATNFVLVDAKGNNPVRSLYSWQTNKRYTLKHYLRYGMVLHGGTFMYRNLTPYRDERYIKLVFAEPTMGDVIHRVLRYDKGDVYVLPDITHAHRSGAETPTSFSAQQNKKALYYTKMFFRIVDNVTAYLDRKYDLEPLKANRMGAILQAKVLGSLPMEETEFKELWNSLTPRLRRLSISRCVQKIARNGLHKVANLFTRK